MFLGEQAPTSWKCDKCYYCDKLIPRPKNYYIDDEYMCSYLHHGISKKDANEKSFQCGGFQRAINVNILKRELMLL
jgi:hypothetical protein